MTDVISHYDSDEDPHKMKTARAGSSVSGRGALAALAIGTLLSSVVGLARSSPIAPNPAPSSLRTDAVETRVDAQIARYFLEEYGSRRGSNPQWDRELTEWRSYPLPRLLEPGRLARIAKASGSVDVAALILASALAEGPLQARFDAQLVAAQSGRAAPGSQYTFVFVPGWLYQSHESTGADFAAPRRLLARLRIDHALVATQENGSIEENARIIEETLVGLSERGRELIVVSTSKGGPEAALALASMNRRASSVAAWLNIGGLLRGTMLADRALEPPRRWFVDTLLWWKGWTRRGLESLATRASARRRPEDTALPSHLMVVSLIAVPLSGDVSKRARDGYRQLRAAGPNDGLTLLTDAIWPSGDTLAILGTDHFFSGVEIDRLTLAVLRTIEQALEDRGAGIPGCHAFICEPRDAAWNGEGSR
jgi:hypothetical protein